MQVKDFKFRVWDSKEKAYLEPEFEKCSMGLLKYTGDLCAFRYFFEDEGFEYVEHENAEIELFTGIYLKGGQGIFENDLIIGKTGDEVGELYQVVYNAKKAFFMAVDVKNKIQIPLSNLLSEAVFEIVGNIHENAELLKEQGC